jgi:hypothetical protein
MGMEGVKLIMGGFVDTLPVAGLGVDVHAGAAGPHLVLMSSAFAGGKQPMAGGKQPMAVLGELVMSRPPYLSYAINDFSSDVEPYFAC